MTNRIAVIGAGPAGTAVACGLAALGYQVVLVNKPRRRYAVEGISDRTLQALQQLNCLNAIASVGMEVVREVTWNNDTSQKNREYILDRSKFDKALLDDANSAGVIVIHGNARQIQLTDDGWQIQVQQRKPDQSTLITCEFLVEARGRGTPKLSNHIERGPAALALSQAWQMEKPYHVSKLATFPHGWGWFIAGRDGHAVLQLMTHGKTQSERSPHNEARSLSERYQQTIDTFKEGKQWIQHAAPKGSVSACGAGMRLNPNLVSRNRIAIGDAALAPDPLSGHGIFEALSSALTAIAVINTILRKSENSQAAFSFYQQRIEQRFKQLSRVGRDFYQQETRWPQETFWAERINWPDQEASHPEAGYAKGIIKSMPIIRNQFIETEPVVVTVDNPLGVLHISGVPLVALLDALGKGPLSLQQAANQFNASPESLQSAYAWLRQHHLI